MNLSKFPGNLPLVILRFSGDIGNGSLCIEVPFVCRCKFLLLRLFNNWFHQYSLQGLVMVDLLYNFLNFFKLFLAIVSDPMKQQISAMMENAWCKERKMIGQLAMPILGADGEGGGMKQQQSANRQLFKLYFILVTSPQTVAPDTHWSSELYVTSPCISFMI
jgi:hypothetical protein